MRRRHHGRSFLHRHSLSLATGVILVSWTILYIYADPSTHWGSFYGNAIADWTGMLVTVLATKFMYEKGSAESRKPKNEPLDRVISLLYDHSLTIFLLVTG